jgi:hypothetical protein
MSIYPIAREARSNVEESHKPLAAAKFGEGQPRMLAKPKSFREHLENPRSMTHYMSVAR